MSWKVLTSNIDAYEDSYYQIIIYDIMIMECCDTIKPSIYNVGNDDSEVCSEGISTSGVLRLGQLSCRESQSSLAIT